MSFGGKSLTVADEARRRCIHTGNCMACDQRGIDLTDSGYVQWHHLNGRKHHEQTIGLCYWHHQARPMYEMTHQQCRDYYGPSLAEGSKPFHAEFGSNDLLLEQQNRVLLEQGVLAAA